MPVSAGQQYVSVQEAAEILGVHRDRVARLLKEGVLSWKPNVLDRRQRLIPRHEVELVLAMGNRPAPSQDRGISGRRATDAISTRGDESISDRPEESGFGGRSPWPRSIGMASNGSLPARESEVWLREHWDKE